MSTILTITLNPAFDVSSSVDVVVPGPKLRCDPPRHDPGGGGVNVSRAIQRLEGTSRAFVAIGGETGTLYRTLLEAEGIDISVFEIAGNTRQSFAIVETSTGKQYRFQLPGQVWSAAQTEAVLEALEAQLRDVHMVVMSGSLPPGVPLNITSTVNRMAIAAGAELILDTSGPALTSAALNRDPPFSILRMDGAEAAEVSGRSFASPRELADYGSELIRAGTATKLVMSIGAQGTVGVTADDRFFCRPPKIETLSAVGAGDSMVAAIAMTLSDGGSFREAVHRGVAAAGSAVMTPATALCAKDTADEIYGLVVTEEI